MSAYIDTEIEVCGTPGEIQAILKVVRCFVTEKFEQYKIKRDCAYFVWVRIKGNAREKDLKDMTDEQIKAFVSESGDTLNIEASGPYGRFSTLDEVGLFETIAEAAPTATFSGCSKGYVTGADVTLMGEFRNGLLYISNYYEPDEGRTEVYQEKIKEHLPYSVFVDLFKVDKDKFDEDCYSDFIDQVIGQEGFPKMKYNQFMEYCEEAGVDEDEYEVAIEKVKNLDLMDYETYRDCTEDDRWDTERVYDPVAKKYVPSRNADNSEDIE